MVGVQKCIGFDFSSCLIVTTTISFLKEMCSRRLYYYYYMPIWFVHMKTIEERKSNLNCDIEFLKWRKPFVVSFFSQTFVDLSLLFRARTTRFHRSKAFNKKKSDHPEVVLCCLVFTLMKKKDKYWMVFCILLPPLLISFFKLFEKWRGFCQRVSSSSRRWYFCGKSLWKFNDSVEILFSLIRYEYYLYFLTYYDAFL